MDTSELVQTMRQAVIEAQALTIAASRGVPAHGLWVRVPGARLRDGILARVERERAVDAARFAEDHVALSFVCEHIDPDATYILQAAELAGYVAGHTYPPYMRGLPAAFPGT